MNFVCYIFNHNVKIARTIGRRFHYEHLVPYCHRCGMIFRPPCCKNSVDADAMAVGSLVMTKEEILDAQRQEDQDQAAGRIPLIERFSTKPSSEVKTETGTSL